MCSQSRTVCSADTGVGLFRAEHRSCCGCEQEYMDDQLRLLEQQSSPDFAGAT